MKRDDKLQNKLNQIKKVFDLGSLLDLEPDQKYIQKYYRASRIGYSLFYVSSDRMYMGISRDGVYKEDDLLEAARTVEKYIKRPGVHNILELATGRGATSTYLAGNYPDIRFDGIELSPTQLGLAKKKAKELPNYIPVAGDYHDLSRYADNSIDIVFVIEALCYSTDKSRVFAEVRRVLKKGGVLIILDGYTTKDRSKMTENELLACKLAEKGVALSVFEDYESTMHKAKKNGFSVLFSENASKYTLPTLERFERYAIRYFNHPRAARTINKFVSKKFTYNAITGLLMPEVVSEGLLGYYITALRVK
ncbi:MAG: class I SAM-dependent methyltransferase [Candidatus Saccharimonadales bacterium]|jgi:ubiquinone/menaquinone biosynthesis C-methylase UbiE